MKKILLLILILIPILFYSLFGIHVIQPIGAVPKGTSVVYLRVGINLPFISSADGWLLDNNQSISLMTRALAMGKILELIADKKIISLPYSKNLYLYSTDGAEFSK